MSQEQISIGVKKLVSQPANPYKALLTAKKDIIHAVQHQQNVAYGFFRNNQRRLLVLREVHKGTSRRIFDQENKGACVKNCLLWKTDVQRLQLALDLANEI